MSALNDYYRSYMELLTRLSEVPDFNNLNKAFKSGNTGKDYYTGQASIREFETDWIEAMESSLVYIDKAIREQRRFILQTDEIVPIEKSRKITTESVRHLAQHTNMIGRVENGSVTPKEILNIQREESFDIYENRFLRTLILRASSFIERCYRETLSANNGFYTKLNMARDVYLNKQNIKFDLDLELEYPGDSKEFLMNEDVSKLTEYQRVLRLRLIFSDFLSTPLMNTLKGTAEVRSPINHTNLLTKDPNFRETVKLWEFLEHYQKTGYYVIPSDDVQSMKASVQTGIYNVISLLQFVVRLNLNSKLKSSLKEQYIAENKEIEKAKKEYEAKLVNDALDKQRSYFNEKIMSYQTQIISLKQEHKEELSTQKQGYETKIKTLTNDYESTISLNKEKYKQELNALDIKHKSEVKKVEKKHTKDIEALNSTFEKEKKQKDLAFKSEIKSINSAFAKEAKKKEKEYVASFSKQEKAYKKDLDNTNKKYEVQISALNKQNKESLKEQKDSINLYWENLLSERSNKFNAQIENVRKGFKAAQTQNEELKSKDKEKSREIRALNRKLWDLERELRRNQRQSQRLERQLSRLEKKK